MAPSKAYIKENVPLQNFAVFGGHRLWHGYSPENSYVNDWSSYISRPVGGYLNDLWIYTKYLDLTTTPGSGYKTNNGLWKLKQPREQCFASPGLAWDTRFFIRLLYILLFKNNLLERISHAQRYIPQVGLVMDPHGTISATESGSSVDIIPIFLIHLQMESEVETGLLQWVLVVLFLIQAILIF
jgi:hypothetical protein